MKSKEFILEAKKPKVTAPKPRNFVAKNQQTAGAGAHRDKKKEQKQGNVKHKAKQFEQGVAEKGYGTHPSQRVDPRTGKKYVPPKSPLGKGVAEGDEPDEEYLDKVISDLHKDALGMRPDREFGREWISSSYEEKLEIYNNLLKNLHNDMDEATGDEKFDTIMRTIKKGTKKQATADRREREADSRQKARDAFGPSPADRLSIRSNKDVEEDQLNELSFEEIKSFYVTYKVITEWGIPLAVMATIVAGLGIAAAVKLIKQGKDAVIKKYREIKGTVNPDDVSDAAKKIKNVGDKNKDGFSEGSHWGEPREILEDVLQTLEREVEWPLTEVMDPKEVRQLLAPIIRAVNDKLLSMDIDGNQ